MPKTFYSNGKLLLTGEYVVLDGAMALAIPTTKGQFLTVEENSTKNLIWQSFDVEGNIWFKTIISLNNGALSLTENDNETSDTLLKILHQAQDLNPEFLNDNKGYTITTHLDFPRDWGLGTSSTLINNIAQWAEVNAFTLLQESFGGSGYDIAAAQYTKSILYQRQSSPLVREVHLPWEFKEQLFFVHLNQKQDSKEGIERYRKATVSDFDIQKISDLSNKLMLCYDLSDFEKIMTSHENIISEIIGLPTVKSALFPSFPGLVKSLGAWGGDFVLASGRKDAWEYFKQKGYHTIISYSEMAL